MGILDTVNARLAMKKAEKASELSPLESVFKEIQEDVQKSGTEAGARKRWADRAKHHEDMAEQHEQKGYALSGKHRDAVNPSLSEGVGKAKDHYAASDAHSSAAGLATRIAYGEASKYPNDNLEQRYADQRDKATQLSAKVNEKKSDAIVTKGCAKCHPEFRSVTDENSTKNHLDTSVSNAINPKKRVKKDFAWLNQNDYSGNKATQEAAQAAKLAARQAAKPKKPYLG